MRLSVLAMLVFAPFLSGGCGERDLDKVIMSEQGAVNVGEIAKRPDAFYGRPVTVVAEVEAVHGPNVFTLDEGTTLAGPDVLVMVPKAARPVEQDRQVTVHGTVRPLVVAEFQRDYAWFNAGDYEPDLLNQFEQRPVIIADSVRDDRGGDVLAGAAKPQMPVN